MRSVIAFALVLSCATVASAQITLDWDFDHGSLDLPGTTITPSLITLKPRTDIYVNRWVHVSASGILGFDPEFRISNDYVAGYSLASTHRYVYSYDQVNWSFFDNGLNSGGYYRFWNDTPFAQDVVWFAYAFPYPLARTDAHTAQAALSQWVTPTPSADANLIVGYSNDGTLTDVGRVVPQFPIYGYRISDDSVGEPKTVVVLTTGNHPNETTGSYTFEGLVDFLLSGDPRASALRQAAEFLVYPNCNPDGRWAGHARSNPENPGIDHNRDWDDPVLFTDLTVLTAAMKFDTSSSVDYFLDFHSFHNNSDIAVWAYPDQTNIPFILALTTREPMMEVLEGSSPPDSPGVSRHWAHSAAGLNAPYTFTPESGFIPGWPISRYMLQGENYALALYDAIVLAGCNDVPTSGVEIYADGFDTGTSGFLWNLYTTSLDYTADFAFDYSAHGIPPAPNTTGSTTIGAKFTVNNNDGLEGVEALSAFPIGASFAGDYVLMFDMWMNYNGGAGGGTGSTEFMTAGIEHSGGQVNWPNNGSSDGVYFAVSGEGDAFDDYRAYDGPTMFTVADGVYTAGSQNHTDSLYQVLFPSPVYETQGVPGKHWVEVSITRRGDSVEWRMNGTLLAVVSQAPVSPGNVMLGYMDVFPSVASPAADNFIIYDNVRVEQLAETDCNANGFADACEVIARGDFDGNNQVDLLDYAALADCLSGPGRTPAPAESSCADFCLLVFDFDDDGDVDLLDYADFEISFSAAP